MQHSRDEIRDALIGLIQPLSNVLAAWEGGSAATGYLDSYSDLDLIIVTQGDDADNLFALIDSHFETMYGIIRKFRVPEPTWHGMSQCFYFLKDTGAYFYCDLAIVGQNNPAKLMEKDRHGQARVYFDKCNVYKPEATSDEELDKLKNRFYQIATSFDFISIRELQKAIARKNWIASHTNYMQFINRNLVIMLNLKYRPEKVDFGIRYAERDYPKELVKTLEDLLRVNSVEEIADKFVIALKLFEVLSAEYTTPK